SPAGDLGGILAYVQPTTVAVVEPSLRQHDLVSWRALATAWPTELVSGERLVGVEIGQQLVEGGQGVDQPESVSQLPAGREALEVPGDVLAELLAAPLLPHVLAQQLGVAAHHGADLPQRGQGGVGRPGEGCGQVTE